MTTRHLHCYHNNRVFDLIAHCSPLTKSSRSGLQDRGANAEAARNEGDHVLCHARPLDALFVVIVSIVSIFLGYLLLRPIFLASPGVIYHT